MPLSASATVAVVIVAAAFGVACAYAVGHHYYTSAHDPTRPTGDFRVEGEQSQASYMQRVRQREREMMARRSGVGREYGRGMPKGPRVDVETGSGSWDSSRV
ncbi:hypothetical protein B0A48_14484 [Cryoendolithus antarcticus]|uniref:Uncharacterized protein n=1 Tax=Cryoendolithus antarcticus TaxID=1507870 RepID=A0A1V8SKM4_9PEZI|nr:hypothetical protein B0A48_14484 [Cryoendolithus antarcticus]